MAKGTFSNGDECTGHQYEEDGRWWYRAIDRDSREYDTEEVPTRKPFMTLRQYVGHWTAADFPHPDTAE